MHFSTARVLPGSETKFLTEVKINARLWSIATIELVCTVESVICRAVEVIGERDEALRWLGTPVRALVTES